MIHIIVLKIYDLQCNVVLFTVVKVYLLYYKTRLVQITFHASYCISNCTENICFIRLSNINGIHFIYYLAFTYSDYVNTVLFQPVTYRCSVEP